MGEEERQRSAKLATDTSGKASLIHDVSDPEEDDLDDLDGMIRALPSTCGAHYLLF